MIVLGIETSCDETAASLLESSEAGFHVLSNVVISQIDVHKKYGGIVPEVAARKQMEAMMPVLQEAIQGKPDPDIIAVTQGPGLITSLRVGVMAAKTLAYVWDKPLVGVNHIEGHIYSAFLSDDRQISDATFPALALIVSGGHTELILIKDHGVYKYIGRTRDDAAGEAFDKVARLLGLPYPGGPEISKLAEKGNPEAIDFPRPMLDSGNFDFSFSGLKTAVLYYLKKHDLHPVPAGCLPDICASFQQSVIDTLVAKTVRAAKRYNVKSVILGGGVSANRLLRNDLNAQCETLNVNCHLSPLTYSTDNAAMIALAGYYKAERKGYADWKTLVADPNFKLA